MANKKKYTNQPAFLQAIALVVLCFILVWQVVVQKQSPNYYILVVLIVLAAGEKVKDVLDMFWGRKGGGKDGDDDDEKTE
jgi:uncharacterized membrane-anchored protein